MSTCFIIQPFDNGQFDKRYEDIFQPAVEAAGLEPYRVDEDPGASIPIESIERGIRDASVCLAEITTNNPNVWFELGFAVAGYKEVALVCSDERESSFPFDIQHRTIIKYKTESQRDFDQLRKKITQRLMAIQEKEASIDRAAMSSPLVDIQGLSQIEIVTLVAIGQNVDFPGEAVVPYRIRRDMESVGFTGIATTLALSQLLGKHLIKVKEIEHTDETGYRLRTAGVKWLLENQEKLSLKKPTDEIPF